MRGCGNIVVGRGAARLPHSEGPSAGGGRSGPPWPPPRGEEWHARAQSGSVC